MPLTQGRLARAASWIGAHKITSTVVILVVLAGGYWTYSKLTTTSGQTKYVVGTVARGTVIASVSGSGQVSPDDQVEIKPKASGEVTSVLIKEGQYVGAGQAIAYVDAQDARKSVRDAQTNLESAQIAYQKLVQPADQLSLTQAKNTLTNASTTLATTYRTAINDVTSSYLDMPDIMTALQDIVTGTATNRSAQWNIDFYKNAIQNYSTKAGPYRDDAYTSYLAARAAYDKALADFKVSNLSNADSATIEAQLQEAYAATQQLSDSIKSIGGFVQFYEDTLKAQNQTPSTVADSQLTTIASLTSKINAHLSALLTDTNSLSSSKQKIVEAQQSLDKVVAGTDALDLKSAQLNITKAQNALTDAQENLSNYTIRAPFSGTIAKLSINKGDQVSSGTTAATIISKTQIADLSLNEVDAAKIKVGQKATLTFDAIDDLTIAGTVASIDTLGTVSSGVVSYTVKVQFSTQDVRIKPGMTANANIITDTRQNVLTVPSSAVKTQGDSSYVQTFSPEIKDEGGTAGNVSSQKPQQITVTVGISDDTQTEIVSGLTEGQQVITRTITSGSTSNTTSSSRGFGGPGVRL